MFESLIVFLKKIIILLKPRNLFLRTKLSDGTVLLGINKPGFGGRGLFLLGEKIEPELSNLNHFLMTGDVFIDVGANSGMYTLKAASLVKDSGLVLGIEPVTEVLFILEKSVRLNKFKNIRLRNICVGEKNSERTFWINHNQPNSSSISVKVGEAESTSVLTVTLDDLVKWENLERVDYLKIDAEGAESEILEGAKLVIERFRPIIQFEEIVNSVHYDFEDYTVFKAENSFNVLLIPNESEKILVPEKLGWKKVKSY